MSAVPQSTMVSLDGNRLMQFIQVVSSFGKRAMDELKQTRESEKAANDLRDSVLKLMLDNQIVSAQQKSAAEKMLATSGGRMQLLKTAVTKLAELKAAESAPNKLGHGVDNEKSASDNDVMLDSLSSPFVGQRTGREKLSDLRFKEGLGL